MATVTVTTVGQVPANKNAPKLQIVVAADDAKNKKSYIFPYGPQKVSLSGIANTFQTIDRPGRPPLFVQSAKGLPTCEFEVTLAHLDRQQSIQPWIDQVKTIGQSSYHLQILYGSSISGYWRLSDMSIDITSFTLTNDPSQATVSMTYTRVSDPSVNVGPVSGGVKKPPVKKAPTTSKTGAKSTVVVYYVKAGDTLWGIALHHYGDGNWYRRIAEYNHIINPNLIRPGQKLLLP